MIVLLFALLAQADETCMTREEFQDRVLVPLIELRKCQQERDLYDATSDRLALAAKRLDEARLVAEARANKAETQAKRARKSRPAWAGGGAGGALLLVLLVVLL